jgi:thiamine-monophosphate kinase
MAAKKGRQGGGELALIEHIRARAARLPATRAVRVGIGDDCAVLRPPAGEEIVVTTDFSLERRHFTRATHPPRAVGHRALARGLSDIAAMGAKPLAAFLSLALPRDVAADANWLDEFLDGLFALCAETGCTLAGGDLSEAPSAEIIADIVVVGSVVRGKALLRSGARPGDAIYVTGALGGAAQELDELLSGLKTRTKTAHDHPHLFPQPRLAVGQALVARKLASACMDLSDGLLIDLTRLCRASDVRSELDLLALPAANNLRTLDPAMRLKRMTTGGEDYELLFTARPQTKMPRSIAGVAITRIGCMQKASGRQPLLAERLSNGKLRALTIAGWEHFA